MVNKQIELTTPTLRTKGSASRPLLGVWIYRDKSLAIAHLDFMNAHKYVLWHAPKSHQLNSDEAGDLNHELYMLGMLSMMDRMLNIPMKQLVDLISVDSRIQEALLGSAEGMGRALVLCEYEERGGASLGLPHPLALVADSSSYYFRALIAAGNAMQGLPG